MHNFFISDQHHNNVNILKYCDRPYFSAKGMNEALIQNWNSRVKPEDTVYVIGDFFFRARSGDYEMSYPELKSKLDGNIVFIKGNHDENNFMKPLIESCIMSLGKYKVAVRHHPPDSLNETVDFYICGHVHDKWKYAINTIDDKIIINVSCDVINYRPIRMDELIGLYEKVKRKVSEGKIIISEQYKNLIPFKVVK